MRVGSGSDMGDLDDDWKDSVLFEEEYADDVCDYFRETERLSWFRALANHQKDLKN